MKKILIGNLKMNLNSSQERDDYLAEFKKNFSGKSFPDLELALCPPFVHLEKFNQERGKKFSLGAQDVFWETKGAYTGEISPLMLKDFGCEYVIVGHSERRKYFLETGELINLKLSSALKNGLKVILCVGETREERERNLLMETIVRQLKDGLSGVNWSRTEQLVIAYEPVWSVGTDVVPTSNEIMEAGLLIRKILVENFGKRYAERVRIIYGGSVSARLVSDLILESGMAGALVGREALIPAEFLKIAQALSAKS